MKRSLLNRANVFAVSCALVLVAYRLTTGPDMILSRAKTATTASWKCVDAANILQTGMSKKLSGAAWMDTLGGLGHLEIAKVRCNVPHRCDPRTQRA